MDLFVAKPTFPAGSYVMILHPKLPLPWPGMVVNAVRIRRQYTYGVKLYGFSRRTRILWISNEADILLATPKRIRVLKNLYLANRRAIVIMEEAMTAEARGCCTPVRTEPPVLRRRRLFPPEELGEDVAEASSSQDEQEGGDPGEQPEAVGGRLRSALRGLSRGLGWAAYALKDYLEWRH